MAPRANGWNVRYAMGFEKNDDGEVCMSTDVERLEAKHTELEAKHCKLLEAHRIMKEALEWMTTDACYIEYPFFSKIEMATKTLERVTEVLS
tara:strand:- start:1142 stop:1417 length:276 start_codon:yes stop_codon:yes gene_type:complete